MPPKIKVQASDIVEAALALVREQGAEALSARAVAARLSCSTQPVFSNFPNMDALKEAVVSAVYARFQEAVQAELSRKAMPSYKAYGMAYIEFAKEEPHWFRFLFASARSSQESDVNHWSQMLLMTPVNGERAEQFHAAMWIFVHGLADLVLSGRLELTREEISALITDQYTHWYYTEKEDAT
ncbi:MAG: TetR/AcrR family transcriptional regulator [Clostridia bacterium]|nr:TetR/AcrR family transcriptional regulator [Clostridia bacterium]